MPSLLNWFFYNKVIKYNFDYFLIIKINIEIINVLKESKIEYKNILINQRDSKHSNKFVLSPFALNTATISSIEYTFSINFVIMVLALQSLSID